MGFCVSSFAEDLTRIVSHEMNENKSLSNQLKALKHVTEEFESQQYDRSDTQQVSVSPNNTRF